MLIANKYLGKERVIRVKMVKLKNLTQKSGKVGYENGDYYLTCE